MSWTRALLLVTLLGGCAAEPKGASQDVHAQVQKTMDAFAAMDVEGFKAGLAEDVTAFEMDLDGKPVRLGSRDEAVRFAEEMVAQLKKMGASMRLDIHKTDCRAGSTLAYCTVEFDLTATMADSSRMVQPTRNTVVLRKGDDGWKWAHWHSSLSVAPEPPAPPPAP